MTIAITQTSLGAFEVGTAISTLTLLATGGTGPYTWAVHAGALPAGLSLSSGGALTGTPLTAGVYSVDIRATDSLSATGDTTFAGIVTAVGTIGIAPATLGTLTQGSALSPVTFVPTGGVAPYTFAIAAQATAAQSGNESALNAANPGALPAGLALDGATGIVSGTPTTVGDYFFSLAVKDSLGNTSWEVITGTVLRNAATIGQNIDLVADNFVAVTVNERLSGYPQTGRLTVENGGFDTTYQGADTPAIPAFMVKQLRSDGVIV